MPTLDALTLALLTGVALAAGFIDAIAGGGGLLTIPALALAGLDPIAAIATNKLQSTCGSGAATLAFARAGHIRLADMGRAALASAGGSILGVLLLSRLPHDWVGGALPVALALVGLYFWFSPSAGAAERGERLGAAPFEATVVPLIGAYDGVFGPGTGSFFMMGYVGLRGMGLVKATAHTKLCNFASNAAALTLWAASGQIVWPAGVLMGAAQWLGARAGAGMAMRDGGRLVRPLLVSICFILALRLAWRQWSGA